MTEALAAYVGDSIISPRTAEQACVQAGGAILYREAEAV